MREYLTYIRSGNMIICRDTTKLDPQFPFEISHYILKQKDNCEDSFHWHSFCEITYVEQGIGSYYVNGLEYSVKKGDLIIFNNAELHGWRVSDEDMHVTVMIFPTEFIADSTSIFNNDYLEPFVERGSNFKNKVDSKDAVTIEIGRVMEEIFREYSTHPVGYQLMVKADVFRILTLLIRYYQNDVKTALSGENLMEKKNAMKRLEEAFYYINSHYTERITLDEVAKSVYMSPNYFSMYFKKVTSNNFSEYVTKLRLKKANEMTMTTDKSMSEIAMECGFRNMSNFYRLYKKHSGNLPQRKTVMEK